MALTKQDVEKIGKLAHIALSEDDKTHFGKEIESILKWIEQLQEVDTDGVEALASVSGATLPWRKDEVTDGNKRDDILANAPHSEYGCFTVPKVIE
ncbi:MAG: Asp-tRNA(Asn)/Glu-tRNA(Gln) amidotransferase subunit GatC [Alphaproteobacteria bacterium]|nr:Asp-tRNA(Asn)/Glu-tRNA(Gln) amidotransferase subunit GatC [Alphaproteobacteria bacterium]